MRNDQLRPKRVPPVMRAGFYLLGLGLLLDLTYHLVAALAGSHVSHSGAFATAVHGVVLAGMLVTFGGLVQVALKPQRIVRRKETR